jgi:hypothetical protein
MPLRIANASGFWGDQPSAAARIVAAEPDLDFLTLDYLAEVSLSIMAIARAKDPGAGFAAAFVEVVRSLCPFWSGGGRTRVVTNAGGLEPEACAQACLSVLRSMNLERIKVAMVAGDDVLPALTRNPAGFPNLESGDSLEAVSPRLVAANAYLGAEMIAKALSAGADIVITGRVADPSLTVGPCLSHFAWSTDDYDRIAGATVAGHLIECGTQACGGFSTDWLNLPNNETIGFPIVEMEESGACVLTKPRDTGGAVTLNTVREQLLYEIGDPANYLSPDVTVSLMTVALDEIAENRVRISGATGRAPTSSYKVSASYRDGYKAHGTLTVFGHDAARKARRAGEGILHRLRDEGVVYREHLVECLGTGASVGGIVGSANKAELMETVLRVSVAADEKRPVERFTREIAPLVTCGPQGVTGYADGRPKALPIFGYWPCLIDKALVTPTIEFVR